MIYSKSVYGISTMLLSLFLSKHEKFSETESKAAVVNNFSVKQYFLITKKLAYRTFTLVSLLVHVFKFKKL